MDVSNWQSLRASLNHDWWKVRCRPALVGLMESVEGADRGALEDSAHEVEHYLGNWPARREEYASLLDGALTVLRPQVALGDPFLSVLDQEVRRCLDDLLDNRFVHQSGVVETLTAAKRALNEVDGLIASSSTTHRLSDDAFLQELLAAFERLSQSISRLPGEVWWPR